MPIYEYRCASCGHELEAIQKFSDEPLSECPACEQQSLKKLISAASFRLKGGGWYETDFKNSDKKKNLADSGEKKDKSESKPDSGKDAKPADGKKADPGKTTAKESGKSGASDKSTKSGGNDSKVA